MRKGQRVRVLRTGELGSVVDKTLIRKKGEVRVYCRVKLDKTPDLDTWFFDDQLGKTKEYATIYFEGEKKNAILVGVEIDHEKNIISNLRVAAANPGDIFEHHGLHVELARTVVKALREEQKKCPSPSIR